MSKIQWYVNRLKAMNLPEVGWRIQQKMQQRQERKRYGMTPVSVSSEVFDSNLANLKFDPKKIGLNFRNKNYIQNTTISLLKGPDYDRWPMTFSYDLDYKQRDDLGDARTNWEKNRHFATGQGLLCKQGREIFATAGG